MASLEMKIKADRMMRELLEQNGLPEPDEVEYGFGCIRFFWHGAKAVVIVDIDEADEADESNGSAQPAGGSASAPTARTPAGTSRPPVARTRR